MRSTEATRTLTSETGTTPRRRAAEGGAARTAGIQRPTLGGVEGRSKKPAPDRRAGVGTGGWAGYNKAKDQRTERYPRYEVEKTGLQIVKLPQAEPFAYIFRHWVAKRPYTCIYDEENEVTCPLCDAGDVAKPVVYYNVIDLGDQARVKVWEMSADPTRKLRKHYDALAGMEPPRELADPDFYFAVSKEQKDRGAWEYTIDRIKARDLAEDFGIDPLDEAEITAAMDKLWDASIIYVSSREQLEEAVGNLE